VLEPARPKKLPFHYGYTELNGTALPLECAVTTSAAG
jgi:hypothetical protein